MNGQNWSWVKLLTFCVTSVVVAALALAIFLATATLALASEQGDEVSNPSATAVAQQAQVIPLR